MSEPNWLGYVGAITGIAGAIMGYISLRRSGKLKALDLRLELRRDEADVRELAQEFPALVERAHRSRRAVHAATGRIGAFQQWLADCEGDPAAMRALHAQLSDPNNDYASASHAELESRLVAVHSLKSQAERLRDKYLAALVADDKERERIAADQRAART
jgi:hypothetical protein